MVSKDATKELIQATNKCVLQNKAYRLMNQPSILAADVVKLRDEAESWDLDVKKDLELTKPQLRSLFRAEVAARLEDPEVSHEHKQDVIASSRVCFGLGAEEAKTELVHLLHVRCRACLV